MCRDGSGRGTDSVSQRQEGHAATPKAVAGPYLSVTSARAVASGAARGGGSRPVSRLAGARRIGPGRTPLPPLPQTRELVAPREPDSAAEPTRDSARRPGTAAGSDAAGDQ